MRDALQFVRELGPAFCLSALLGILLGFIVGLNFGFRAAASIDEGVERERRIEQLCIDGNVNACRVMEHSRG